MKSNGCEQQEFESNNKLTKNRLPMKLGHYYYEPFQPAKNKGSKRKIRRQKKSLKPEEINEVDPERGSTTLKLNPCRKVDRQC